MAKALNKKRLRDSRIAMVITLALYMVSYGLLPNEDPLQEVFEFIGYFLIVTCAFGRIYCTAFLGGYKNIMLVTHGPFSLTRNPLYMFSFIGIVGVGMMSTRITVLGALLLLHIINYRLLVRREEARLLELFDDEYKSYCARVPRFFPNFKHYVNPDSVELRVRTLYDAMRDGLAWFLPYPIFQCIEYLQGIHWLPTLFLLP